MMRVLLAGCSPTAECFRREVAAHLRHDAVVATNLHPLAIADRVVVEREYAGAPRVTLVDFDPDAPDALLDVLTGDALGFDAVVYPPHCYGFSEQVLSAVLRRSELLHRLRVICCPNVSLESFAAIDALARSAGVEILNTPDIHGLSVAEYTLCHFGFLSRRLGYFHAATGRDGQWPHEQAIADSRSLLGRTVGVLGGSGKDGSAVVTLARKMGMNVVCEKPRLPSGEKLLLDLGATLAADFAELLAEADFLSVNCKNSAESRGKIGATQIGMMKIGVIIVNPAGAEILDRQALLQEFSKLAQDRRIGDLVLDMPYGGRRGPGAFDADPANAALKEKGVLFTPRMAGYTLDAREHAVVAIAEVVDRHLSSGTADGCRALAAPPPVDGRYYELLLERLVGLTRAAGQEAMRLHREGLSVTYKADHSPSTNADVFVEEFIRHGLHEWGYVFCFKGEESGPDENRSAEFEVLVDGIDGTRNFRDGNYGWCTSVAIIVAGRTKLAVVNDAPTGMVYFARREGGAFMRSAGETRRFDVPKVIPDDFSFSVGSFRIAGSSEVKRRIIEDIKNLGGREREWGCVGLSICAVARGGLGTFIQYNSPEHDHVAAILIAEEAGADVAVRWQNADERADVIVCHPRYGMQVAAVVNAQVAVLQGGL